MRFTPPRRARRRMAGFCRGGGGGGQGGGWGEGWGVSGGAGAQGAQCSGQGQARSSLCATHGDALDVVAQHLAVALGAALAQTLATLATARHCERRGGGEERDEGGAAARCGCAPGSARTGPGLRPKFWGPAILPCCSVQEAGLAVQLGAAGARGRPGAAHSRACALPPRLALILSSLSNGPHKADCAQEHWRQVSGPARVEGEGGEGAARSAPLPLPLRARPLPTAWPLADPAPLSPPSLPPSPPPSPPPPLLQGAPQAAGHQGSAQVCACHWRRQEASPLPPWHCGPARDQALPEVH